MAALPNTDNLDIPSRGLPALYIVNLDTGPNVQTDLLDTPSRGLPAMFPQPSNTVSSTGYHVFGDEGLIY